jgi:hypothetical protein
MSGPDSRIKRKQIKEYSVHVMEAARTIGAALGYSNRLAAYPALRADPPPPHQSRRVP